MLAGGDIDVEPDEYRSSFLRVTEEGFNKLA